MINPMEGAMAKKGNKQMIGIVLLAVGVGLIAWGLNDYGAFGSKLTRAIGRSMSTEVMAMFAGGAVCTLAGLAKLLKK